MKLLFLSLLLFIFGSDINQTAYINRMKKEAEKAYAEKKYDIAAARYKILVDSLGLQDDEILLNLSHCYYNLQDTTNALNHYRQLFPSENPGIRSVAYQQAGILDVIAGRYPEAEEDFRNALRANPANEDARFNYELLKKRMLDQKEKDKNKPENQKDKKDQQNKDQDKQKEEQDKKQEKKDQEGQQKNEQEKKDQEKQARENSDKAKEDKNKDEEIKSQQEKQDRENKENEKKQLLNSDKNAVQKISAEKARMILEAMRNAEQQYLQQRQRKATKRPDSGKPDW